MSFWDQKAPKKSVYKNQPRMYVYEREKERESEHDWRLKKSSTKEERKIATTMVYREKWKGERERGKTS